MITYRTDLPCKPLWQGMEYGDTTVDSARTAAKVFASRYAKRCFGGRGSCHHVRSDSWTVDEATHVFEAFIGLPCGNGGMSGRNIRLTVTVTVTVTVEKTPDPRLWPAGHVEDSE